MASKKGNLSINSENMFPIIKKWLYSDHDIFYREVISNACDAITKIRKMDMMGEYTLPDGFKPRVDVVLIHIVYRSDKEIADQQNNVHKPEAQRDPEKRTHDPLFVSALIQEESRYDNR